MWLYYYRYFLQSLVALYDASGPEIDKTDEWPTRTSYLIYALFDGLVDWIEIVKNLPEDSPHRIVDNVLPQHANDNIPKSAALALGSCLDTLLRAPNVDERFRRYIHDIVLRAIREFARDGSQGRFRTIMINAVVQRGPLGANQDYGQALKALWEQADPVMRADLGDYQAALIQAYG